MSQETECENVPAEPPEKEVVSGGSVRTMRDTDAFANPIMSVAEICWFRSALVEP